MIKALHNASRDSEERERQLQQAADQVLRERGLTPKEREKVLCRLRKFLEQERIDQARLAWERTHERLFRLAWRIVLVLCILLVVGALKVVHNWTGELIR